MNALPQALKMAGLGIPIELMEANTKACRQPNWESTCTTDTNEIIARAKLKPTWTNYALVAKAVPGGFLFLDDDGGIRAIFESQGNKMEPTLKQKSCGGKFHYIYKHSPASLAFFQRTEKAYIGEKNPDGEGEFWSLRINNSYIVGAGSVAPPKKGEEPKPYELAYDATIIEIPDALLSFLIERWEAAEKKVATTAAAVTAAIPNGARNKTITSRLGKIHHAAGGASAETLLGAARDINQYCETPLDDSELKTIADSVSKYPVVVDEFKERMEIRAQEQKQAQAAAIAEIPIIDCDEDDLPEMEGGKLDTKVYEDLAKRSTEYPDPGQGDFVSLLAHQLVQGTNISLAYTREPLKAIVNHVLDGQVLHPAYPKLSLRGLYFSIGEADTGKTKGLEFALEGGKIVLDSYNVLVESLFKYKSEVTFIRSFTPEGTQKRDPRTKEVVSGHRGHPSQFLIVKEGSLIANCSDYFAAVFARLTDLYDQTDAGTSSMSNGEFEAKDVRVSAVLCFTPESFTDTFTGKGSIGGGGLSRWAIVNPPESHEYDAKDWERLPDSVILATQKLVIERCIKIMTQASRVAVEEPEATRIRLQVKAELKSAGKVGKRLMDYFVREQLNQAAMSIENPFVMTGAQAQRIRAWVDAQILCRLDCWPSDSENPVEAKEHAIRKAVDSHFVPESKIMDACHYYRPGSGGWWAYNTAMRNMRASGAIKFTGMTRKGKKAFCPASCTIHALIPEKL